MVKAGTKTLAGTRRKAKNTASFNTYIARVLRQVQPSLALIASRECSSRSNGFPQHSIVRFESFGAIPQPP